VNLTDEPPIVVHIIRGSDPTLSRVVPADDAVAATGKVTGTGTLQELLFVESVTAVMVLFADVCQTILGLQPLFNGLALPRRR
jgi:hypothetical protein